MTWDSTTVMAVSGAAVAVIGALAGAVVTIMKGIADMRTQIAKVDGKVDVVHAAVNGAAAYCFSHGPAGEWLRALSVRYGNEGMKSGAGVTLGVPR